MKHTIYLLFLINLFLSNQALAATQFFSRYTSLEETNCYIQQQHEEEIWLWCPAFAGYQVMISEYADASVSLVKNTQKYPLGEAIAEGMLGKQLEWRFIQKHQNFHDEVNLVAVIFRGTPDSGYVGTPTSNLYVSKVTPQTTCLVAVVPPQAKQNEAAQNIADNAQNKPCIKQ